MIYQLIKILFIFFLFEGCASDKSNKKNIEQSHRKIISYKTYFIESQDSQNSIFLQIPDSGKSGLQIIKVKLTHRAGFTPMSNLVLSLSTEYNGYFLVDDDFRYLEKEFNSINDTIVERELSINKIKFRSFNDSVDLSYSEVKRYVDFSKKITISATMTDPSVSKNSFSSSFLRHSNWIEIIYE